jgi:hypothetical protein
VLSYLSCSYITGAAFWANWHAEFYGPYAPWDENKLYGDTSACRQEIDEWTPMFMLALTPLGWVAAPFATGFYQDGFDWKWIKRPCTSRAQ